MERICANGWCKKPFEVINDDFEFYDKISPVFAGKKYPIPEPTLCPECRFQRRMIWRSEHALKNRTCDLCKRPIISVHDLDAPYPVYCQRCWWSDNWDPLSYGKAIDPDRSIIEQFHELQCTVPQLTMQNDDTIGSENCEYSHDFAYGKNCYLITGGWKLQDCYYCDCNCLTSRHLFDCYGVHFSELTCDSVASQRLYRCACMQHSESCNDCIFGIDLKGCKDCIGCIGQRQKQFCILNEQYSEKEYHLRKTALHLNSWSGFRAFQNEFEQWILKFPRKNVHLVNCENCIGDDLFNSKDIVMGFQFEGAEYCKYIVHGDTPKNCYDVSQTGLPEWCYEGATPDKSYMTHFTTWCWSDKYTLYSDNCHFSDYLFGCIALKHKKYCIFNKQYAKDEYEHLAGKIIEKMMHDKEWGEFFPMNISPFRYNETAAKEYCPQTKEWVLARGLKWRDDDVKLYKPATGTVADRIEDVPDNISECILTCGKCKKNYKILQQELAYYKDMKLPAPHYCYACRWEERVKRRNPRKLWQRSCAKCKKEMYTSYAPDRPEIVYCEECYLKEVY